MTTRHLRALARYCERRAAQFETYDQVRAARWYRAAARWQDLARVES